MNNVAATLVRRGRSRRRKPRISRFEELESRHLLSITNPTLPPQPLDAAAPVQAPAQTSQASAPLARFDDLTIVGQIEPYSITAKPGVQQMPSVTVNPADVNHVVIAYMDYSLVTTGYAGIGVAVSHDGGREFQYSSIPLPSGFKQGAANPIAKFDDQGHVFVSFMAATFLGDKPPITNPGGGPLRALGHEANNGIFVSRSDDGGSHWTLPIAVTSHLFNGTDKVPFEIIPDLAIDTFRTLPGGRANPNYGNMYEVWSRYYPAGQFPGQEDSQGGANIMIAVSRDGGQTWQTQLESHPAESGDPITVLYNKGFFVGREIPEGLSLENWAHVDVGPEGDVYVSQFLGGQFVVHYSSDGAKSFSHPDLETGAGFPFGINNDISPGRLPTIQSRLQVVRAIVADPTRPGTVYVAEGNKIGNAGGGILDGGDIVFARSADYGRTWQTTFQIDTQAASVVNDDNDGQRVAGRPDDLPHGQALPRLVVDPQGNLALIWYDTRRDPADHMLDVFGAVSLDGGRTFSRNFRVTGQSFDPDSGRFTDATQNDDYYLGDFLGLASADDVAYAAWTDTSFGNQDIFFTRYSITRPPTAPNDRFEPNETAAAVTDLGQVAKRELPNLSMAPGDQDWFRVRAAATGELTIKADLAQTIWANGEVTPGDAVRLELFDETGTRLLATGAAPQNNYFNSQVVSYHSVFGQTHLVHVLPSPTAHTDVPARYTLSVSSLTADLGTREYGYQPGSLALGDEALYSLSSAASGSLEVNLTPGTNVEGKFHLEVLDSKTLTTLASGQLAGGILRASLPVPKDQTVYLHVVGETGAHGDFALDFTNLDQYHIPNFETNVTFFLPTSAAPSETALADLNGDGALDIVVSHVGRDVISVLLSRGDGTFQSSREFAVGAFQQGGPFTLQGLPNFHRDLSVADFDRDGHPDVVVVNTSSGDISVLLGNGDGTFQPQRRFDATAAPFAMATGDLNNDGLLDVVVIDSTSSPVARAAVLLGRDARRGNVSFQTPKFFNLAHREPNRTNSLVIADVNHDGRNDLVERDFVSGVTVLLGNGDGTFATDTDSIQLATGPGLAVADLDGDGNLDVVTTQNNRGNVAYTLGNGDGAFQGNSQDNGSGQFPVAVATGDFAAVQADGSILMGAADGHQDLIVANNGHELATFSGPAEVVLLPGLVDDKGHFAGFGDPVRLAYAEGPLDVKTGDVNGDGVLDVVVVDRNGVVVIFGEKPVIQPNNTPHSSSDLGTVVHLVLPTLTISPGHRDAWYQLQVPTEAYPGAGYQVLDFSAGFAHVEGAGLTMEVKDRLGLITGSTRGRGDRFRVVARQGETLFVHIFGETVGGTLDVETAPYFPAVPPPPDPGPGTGTYTLVIDTLPQVAGVEAQSLLPGRGSEPGGPTTSLVLVFQGDRLDASTAEDSANYRVTWLGPDGVYGTADDAEIPIGMGLSADSQAVVYDAGSNVDVSSGRTYPTAVRQTVTLLFGQSLPAGSYRIAVSSKVGSAAFNEDELSLLSNSAAETTFTVGPVAGYGDKLGEFSEPTPLTGHPIVSIDGRVLREGASWTVQNLVQAAGALGDFSAFEMGTRFLTQFHNDLGALLDAQLTAVGDDQSITQKLLDHIDARFDAALGGVGQRLVSLAVIFLDPVSIGLVDPDGRSFTYNLKDGSVANRLPGTFVEVGGNVEVVVIPNPIGIYTLNVADVPDRARGGLVYLSGASSLFTLFTESMRAAISQFALNFGAQGAAAGAPTPDPILNDDALGSIAAGISASRNATGPAFAGPPTSELATLSTVEAKHTAEVSHGAKPGLARASTHGGTAPRSAANNPLEALGEILSEWLDGLTRGLLRGLRGGNAAAGNRTPAGSPLTPWWRAITRLFEGAKVPNGSRTSSRPGRVTAPQALPLSAPTSESSRPIRQRAAARLEPVQVPLRLPEAALSMKSIPRRASKAEFNGRMRTVGDQAKAMTLPNGSSAGGKATVGGSTGATSG